MPIERHLRRKLTLRAHGEQVVFVKKKHERIEHVWMKAFLWALYLPHFPDLSVEIKVGDRYKPDVVSLDTHGDPRFWGEAGAVTKEKIHDLIRRYPRTHFAMAKWDAALDPYVQIVQEATENQATFAPFDLISIPPDAAERFISDRGEIALSFDDVGFYRIGDYRQ